MIFLLHIVTRQVRIPSDKNVTIFPGDIFSLVRNGPFDQKRLLYLLKTVLTPFPLVRVHAPRRDARLVPTGKVLRAWPGGIQHRPLYPLYLRLRTGAGDREETIAPKY